MVDIKDQMIEEQQERRERMHEAVDDIESVILAQTWYMSQELFCKFTYILQPL